MISVVMLSWKREEGVRRICAALAGHPLVDEIIVWNNNPDLALFIDGATTINCSRDMGLYSRFAAASMARNECILYHDDDLLAGPGALEALYASWQKRPDVCHSLFGRRPGIGGQYNMQDARGPVEIVLTRFVLAPRAACLHAHTRTPRFRDLQGIPAGNGEDIILSYATMDLSRQLNQAYRWPFEDLGQDEGVSIHMRFARHEAHRTEVIKRCREVFQVGGVVRQGRREHYWRALKQKVLKRLRPAGG